MAQNSKLVVMLALIVFAAIGFVISSIIRVEIGKAAVTSTGTTKDIFNVLTTPGFLEGILWLLVCIVCYIGVQKVIEAGETVGPLSLFFLLIWIGALVGLFVGFVIYAL